MSLADDVVKNIDRNELNELALSICNIDSAGPTEAAVAERVFEWLKKEGFKARKLGLLADRFNVMGLLPGSGGGYSILFNSHMDTAVRVSDTWSVKDPDADVYHRAWIDGDRLVGEGIVNDKGPMAAFLIAAKAVKATGVSLKGDLLLTAVVAETSHEPSDGAPGTLVETKDLGARFLVTHGGVADYALIAEGTGFSIVTVEAGMLWMKLTWISDQPRYYTPYLPDRTNLTESPNMIVRAGVAIAVLENWAAKYQVEHSYKARSGLVVPKAQIGAIRGGNPDTMSSTPQICSIYVGAFIVPGQDPLAVKAEVEAALRAAGVLPSEIEIYCFRRGYEAQGSERLEEALLRAHRSVFEASPPPPTPPTCSMWRDINIFNEVGIPAITYGPRSESHSTHRSFPVDALYKAACVYGQTIVDICNQEKPAAEIK
jgi:acetylornithine deacetylase/succinyl-diaminopimelate desuccinylase-like protein